MIVHFSRTRIQPTNSLHATDLFLYPLETLEKVCFSNISRGIERDQLREMGWYAGSFNFGEKIIYLVKDFNLRMFNVKVNSRIFCISITFFLYDILHEEYINSNNEYFVLFKP